MLARLGVIGWNYPEWRGLVYPEGAPDESFLTHYAARFPTVEVAASYYRFPTKERIAAWLDATPSSFRFAFKLPDWITKSPVAPEVPDRIRWFLERVAPMREAGQLGTIVAQFPPFFRRERKMAELEAFVQLLTPGYHWAVELRHASWWRQDVYKLLEAANVTLVWSSIESGRTPAVLTTDRAYLRLFGDRELQPPYDRKRRDRAEELQHWADALKANRAEIREADVMISKFLEGYAPGSAETMAEMLGLPPLDVGDPRGRRTLRQTTLG